MSKSSIAPLVEDDNEAATSEPQQVDTELPVAFGIFKQAVIAPKS